MQHAASVLVLALTALACGSTVAPRASSAASSPADHADAPPVSTGGRAALTVVAESARQWTGLAVDAGGRIYVNYPRWSDDVPISVAALADDGRPEPFPDEAWNRWTPEADPAATWVCVQSVVMDVRGRLWVLDPGAPKFAGVVEGAPKLVRFDLPSRQPAQVVRFTAPVVKPGSYLNDVRIDLERQRAYLTDSGDGALVVVNLEDGTSRRLLDDHPSTEAEDIVLQVGGVAFSRPVHADGIAYDPTGDWVYYQALRGRTLYRIRGARLRDADLGEAELAAAVERVAESGASDGLLFHRGRVFISALERDAIVALRPAATPGAEPRVETVVRDPRIAWPDSFARRSPSDGAIYFTTTQIHRRAPSEPYRVWLLTIGDASR